MPKISEIWSEDMITCGWCGEIGTKFEMNELYREESPFTSMIPPTRDAWNKYVDSRLDYHRDTCEKPLRHFLDNAGTHW